MIDAFDVLDLVEAEIKAGEVREVVQAFDMTNSIIIEVKLSEGLAP